MSECGFDSAYANIIWFAFKHTSIMILIEKPVKKVKTKTKQKKNNNNKQTNSEKKNNNKPTKEKYKFIKNKML